MIKGRVNIEPISVQREERLTPQEAQNPFVYSLSNNGKTLRVDNHFSPAFWMEIDLEKLDKLRSGDAS